jgi:hypothetical protein
LTLLTDIVAGARFFASLPGFLRTPITLGEARRELARRLAEREADFLLLMRQAVFDNPRSLYRPLLAAAGCEAGDLARLVAAKGVEGALRSLLDHGVYLTVDELKGRRPIVRGRLTVPAEKSGLLNPRAAPCVPGQTSGTRGAPMAVSADLTHLRAQVTNFRLLLAAPEEMGRVHAVWGVPGAAAMLQMLVLRAAGARVVRWFSQVSPTRSGLHPRYRLSARVMDWGARLARRPLPRPEHVPLDGPMPIVRWMTDALAAGARPHLLTFSSSGVRLCRAALDAGVSLRGARLWVGGEPTTAARLAVMRQAGVEVVPRAGSAECGAIGHGCATPEAADDLHVFHDLHATIRAAGGGPDLPEGALLLSSIRPTAPLVLLNASVGDRGILAERPCGCALGALGWTTHLHTFRSFARVTSRGLAFLDGDLVQILDEVLPTRHGGTPTDYQLIEEVGPEPRLRLLVHPRLGPLDAAAVARTFLDAVGRGSGIERITGLVWKDAGIVEVERQAPRATAAGKIVHVVREDPATDGARWAEMAAP